MKKVWITALDKNEEEVQRIIAALKKYGLDVNGSFWLDDPKRMAWASVLDEMKASDVWVIVGSPETFARPSIRFGLSMLALCVQCKKGSGFPIILSPSGGELAAESLPVPLRGAEILSSALPGFGPRVVSSANMPLKKRDAEYRVCPHPLPGIGLWFEVGPAGMDWQGAFFGVHGAEIDFHGVGPANGIPERAVLEYPVRGMKMMLGDKEISAWGIRNRLDVSSSYYVRVQGEPEAILFGPYPDGDEIDAHVISF
jgi:hypothetical protein